MIFTKFFFTILALQCLYVRYSPVKLFMLRGVTLTSTDAFLDSVINPSMYTLKFQLVIHSPLVINQHRNLLLLSQKADRKAYNFFTRDSICRARCVLSLARPSVTQVDQSKTIDVMIKQFSSYSKSLTPSL